VAFFELPEPEPARRRPRRRRGEDEDLTGRPRRMLPGYLGGDLLLGVSEEVAVTLRRLACYPSGFSFILETADRYLRDEDEVDPHGVWAPGSFRRREVPDTILRFGVSYSNGHKATTLEPLAFAPWHFEDESGEPKPHLALDRGGGGSATEVSYDLWVSPLPPPGPVTFACEWPAFGIPETLRRIDASRFHKAAAKARRIF
jgi:hypothetical protein